MRTDLSPNSSSELFEVRQTQGVTQYIPSVRNTDPTVPSPPEELDYPTKLNNLSGGVESRHARQHRHGTGCCNPAQGQAVRGENDKITPGFSGHSGSSAPPAQTFDGETIEPCDEGRLQAQLKRVYTCCSDGKWRTLSEIAETTGDPLQSVSARLRDFRKPKFGGYTVNRRRRGEPSRGVFEYQLIT